MSGLSRLSSTRDQLHLDGSQRVLQLWATRDPTTAEPEAEVLRQAIAEADWDSVERYVGFNPALKRMTQLARESPLSIGREMIDHFQLWGSRRCRRRGVRLTNVGPDMISTTTTPLSQRRGASPLWSRSSPKRRTGSGTTRTSRVPCDQPKRGCTSRVPLPRAAAARRTGGVLVVGATPGFSALVRHERGQGRTGLRTPYPPRSGVAPTPVIPGGKAIERCSGLRRSTRAGQVAGPLIHEPAPELEHVRARVGCHDRVADHMR